MSLALVIDMGSHMFKAGFAGDDFARACFRTVYGTPLHKHITMPLLHNREQFVGDEAMAKRGILTLQYPIENGIIQNLDQAEKLFHHSFYNELCVAPEEHLIAINEPLHCPFSQKAHVAQLILERYHSDGILFCLEPLVHLHATGKATGIVTHFGHCKTSIVPIVDNVPMVQYANWFHVGGRDITSELMARLTLSGIDCYLQDGIVEDIKHGHGFVKLNNSAPSTETEYEMPDGVKLYIKDELHECNKLFQDASLAGHDETKKSITSVICDTIASCKEYEQALSTAVVICGGTSFTKHLDTMMLQQLQSKYSKGNLIAPPDRKFLTFSGMSIVASMPEETNSWILRQAYEEEGERILKTHSCQYAHSSQEFTIFAPELSIYSVQQLFFDSGKNWYKEGTRKNQLFFLYTYMPEYMFILIYRHNLWHFNFFSNLPLHRNIREQMASVFIAK